MINITNDIRKKIKERIQKGLEDTFLQEQGIIIPLKLERNEVGTDTSKIRGTGKKHRLRSLFAPFASKPEELGNSEKIGWNICI